MRDLLAIASSLWMALGTFRILIHIVVQTLALVIIKPSRAFLLGTYGLVLFVLWLFSAASNLLFRFIRIIHSLAWKWSLVLALCANASSYLLGPLVHVLLPTREEVLRSEVYQFVVYGVVKLVPTGTLSVGEVFEEVCPIQLSHPAII